MADTLTVISVDQLNNAMSDAVGLLSPLPTSEYEEQETASSTAWASDRSTSSDKRLVTKPGVGNLPRKPQQVDAGSSVKIEDNLQATTLNSHMPEKTASRPPVAKLPTNCPVTSTSTGVILKHPTRGQSGQVKSVPRLLPKALPTVASTSKGQSILNNKAVFMVKQMPREVIVLPLGTTGTVGKDGAIGKEAESNSVHCKSLGQVLNIVPMSTTATATNQSQGGTLSQPAVTESSSQVFPTIPGGSLLYSPASTCTAVPVDGPTSLTAAQSSAADSSNAMSAPLASAPHIAYSDPSGTQAAENSSTLSHISSLPQATLDYNQQHASQFLYEVKSEHQNEALLAANQAEVGSKPLLTVAGILDSLAVGGGTSAAGENPAPEEDGLGDTTEAEKQQAVAAVIELLLTQPDALPTNELHVDNTVPSAGELSQSLDQVYCVECNENYTWSCPHHDTNYAHISDSPMPTRARATVPSQCYLGNVAAETSIMGVYCKSSIAAKTRFGPLEGILTTEHQSAISEVYVNIWKIFQKNQQVECLNCSSEHHSNWLRFMRRAQSDPQQNVTVYQSGRELYFITTRDIGHGEELMYWYAKEYAVNLDEPLTPQGIFECPTCKKQCLTRQALSGHVSQFHPDMSKRRHECTACGKLFLTRTKLKLHNLVHTGMKPHRCPKCGKLFSEKSNLNKHIKIHVGEKNFECHMCKLKFRQKAHLQTHMLVHTGERKLQCRYCEKRFMRSADVLAHERQHTQDRSLLCCICDRQFYRRQNLQRHLRTHADERNHACSKCHKTFRERYHMKRHVERCKGLQTTGKFNIGAGTVAELGLSIAKRRIQKLNNELRAKELASQSGTG